MSRAEAERELHALIDAAPDWAVAAILWITRRALATDARPHSTDGISTPQEVAENAADIAVARVNELLTHGTGGVVSGRGIRARR